MNKLKDLKKHQIFLLVAFSLLLLSIIVIFLLILRDYFYYQANYPEYLNDPDLTKLGGFDVSVAYTIIAIIPSYIVAFTGIRCVYKLLKYNIKGFIKICYIIAAVIVFLAIIFQIMYIFGCFRSPFTDEREIFFDRLFWISGIPVAIFSFILGSLPVKSKAKKEVI